MAESRTKQKNRLETATFSVSVTPGIYVLLERLTDTHFFGRSVPETASQVLSAEVKRLSLSGELTNLMQHAPAVALRKGDEEQDEDGAA